MTTQGSGRSCLFCGRREVTNEHIFPQWLSKWLRGQGVQQFFLETSHWGNRTTSAIDLKIRKFCDTCNGVWMGEMETAVKPLLTTMIRDTTPRSILQLGQIHLARWGFKTILTLLAAQQEGTIPPLDLYRGFRRWQTPPAALWIGCCSPVDLTVRFDVKLLTHDHTGTELYQVMLLIGRLFVASIYSVNPEVSVHLDLKADVFTPIWPPIRPVVWPPPVHVDPDELFRI